MKKPLVTIGRLLISAVLALSCTADAPTTAVSNPELSQATDETWFMIEAVQKWWGNRGAATIGILDEGRAVRSARALVLTADGSNFVLSLRSVGGQWIVTSTQGVNQPAGESGPLFASMTQPIARMSMGDIYHRARDFSDTAYVHTWLPVAAGTYAQFWDGSGTSSGRPGVVYTNSFGDFFQPLGTIDWAIPPTYDVPSADRYLIYEFKFMHWGLGAAFSNVPCAWAGHRVFTPFASLIKPGTVPQTGQPCQGPAYRGEIGYRIEVTEACGLAASVVGPNTVYSADVVTYTASVSTTSPATSNPCNPNGGPIQYYWTMQRDGSETAMSVCGDAPTCSVYVEPGPSFTMRVAPTRAYQFGAMAYGIAGKWTENLIGSGDCGQMIRCDTPFSVSPETDGLRPMSRSPLSGRTSVRQGGNSKTVAKP